MHLKQCVRYKSKHTTMQHSTTLQNDMTCDVGLCNFVFSQYQQNNNKNESVCTALSAIEKKIKCRLSRVHACDFQRIN